jgi:hypothetical protein
LPYFLGQYGYIYKLGETGCYNKEEMTHFHLKNSKNSPRTVWALGSQSLASHLMRVSFSLNDNKMRMGYGVDHEPKDICEEKLYISRYFS